MKEPKTAGEESLSKREYHKLLEVVECLEDKILLMLAVNIGCRRIDIVNIKVADINLQDQKVTYFEHKKDKTRTVPINKRMTQELQIYLNTLPKKQKYLFSFSDRTAYNRLHYLCHRAGVRPRPFHALRATCYKFCQDAKWSPEAAAKLIGDSIRVAQLHYATPSEAEMEELVEQRDD